MHRLPETDDRRSRPLCTLPAKGSPMIAIVERPERLPNGSWCTRCGARPGIAGPAWICRICIARPERLPDYASVYNPRRLPLPPGTPGARERYRAVGLCNCGRRRDRADRVNCKRCRRRLADTTQRYRLAHPGVLATGQQAHRDYLAERRQRRTAAGRCPECGGERDRPADRKLCARCRRRAADSTAAYRTRRAARADSS